MSSMDENESRTRISYDAVAERYAVEIAGELADKPLDRALLDCLVELSGNTGKIADVGCGPGHVAAYLAGRGAEVVGIDLSPGMVEVARRRNPGLRFEVGSLTALPVPDATWAGAVCAYSIIHVPSGRRPVAYAELARAIAPGGWLLISFHLSDADRSAGETAHLDDWWGTEVDLDFHFLDQDEVADGLTEAGFDVRSRTVRDPWPGVEHASRRAYLLASRTGVLR
ncbi:class I SAM-dependent methyltransferase [Planosporangium mesophilum]|nr:class I SAM-dependent methyltransferase [Planosporangium mesophilum]